MQLNPYVLSTKIFRQRFIQVYVLTRILLNSGFHEFFHIVIKKNSKVSNASEALVKSKSLSLELKFKIL